MPEQQLSKQTKMAMASQFLGFMLDAYDMAMVLVMAPILVKVFVSPKGSAAWQYIVDRVQLFHYHGLKAHRFGDLWTLRRQNRQALPPGPDDWRRGRDVTAGGFLPTYAQIGVWSYVIFCSLRLCMGVFFGGEYAVGHTFAIEYAPQKRRGAIGGFIQSGFPLGYVFASLVFALISFLTTKEAMAAYGWRIAFMSGVIPVFLALYIRSNLQESPEFEKTKAEGKIEKSPFLNLFKPPQLWEFLQVFFFMTGLFFTDYSVYGFLPNILTLKGRGFNTTTVQPDLRLCPVHGLPRLQLLRLAIGQDGTEDSYPVVLRLSRRLWGSRVLRSLSRGDRAEPVDGGGRMVHGGDAQAGMGRSTRISCASASRLSGALRVWASATPRERCWERGSASTCGGPTRFPSLLRLKSRTCGYRRRSS